MNPLKCTMVTSRGFIMKKTLNFIPNYVVGDDLAYICWSPLELLMYNEKIKGKYETIKIKCVETWKINHVKSGSNVLYPMHYIIEGNCSHWVLPSHLFVSELSIMGQTLSYCSAIVWHDWHQSTRPQCCTMPDLGHLSQTPGVNHLIEFPAGFAV